MPSANRSIAIALGAFVGVGTALVGAVTFPVTRFSWDVAPISGQLLDEAAGSIEVLAFHFVPEAEPIFRDVYQALLPSLDSRTRLVALVPPPGGGVNSADTLRDFLRNLPNGESLLSRTRIAVAEGPISPWSKDRALVTRTAPIGLYAPAEPAGPGERWRADWRAPWDLTRAFPSELHTATLPLDFDAGDFAVTGGRLLVDANLIAKNAGRGLDSSGKLAGVLRRLFQMEVIVLGNQPGEIPRHHLSMYLTPLTDGLVLVGDPRQGRRLLGERFLPGEVSPDSGLPLVADFSEAMAARYDRAAAQLAAAGLRVVRIPTVPFDDKTYFAYTNGVFETRGGRRIAWVPTFDLPDLDRAALSVYASLGWETRPVPSRAAFPYHGTVGCLVNVLARGG